MMERERGVLKELRFWFVNNIRRKILIYNKYCMQQCCRDRNKIIIYD
jgi:hypothetical protein